MQFGRLVAHKAKGPRKCEHCEGEVPGGDMYLGMVYQPRAGFRLKKDYHWGCLLEFVKQELGEEKPRLARRAVPHPSKPRLDLDPIQLQKRRNYQINVSKYRGLWLQGYEDGDQKMVARGRQGMARTLRAWLGDKKEAGDVGEFFILGQPGKSRSAELEYYLKLNEPGLVEHVKKSKSTFDDHWTVNWEIVWALEYA